MQFFGRHVLPFAVLLCAMASPALAIDLVVQTSVDNLAAQLGAEQATQRGDQLSRPVVSGAKAPSPNATVNLVNLLVKQGVITEEQGKALIKQAEDEAYIARQANQTAATKADEAQKTASAAANAASPPGTKRVTYVPEIVKRELREELKQEVMEKAKKENWAAPNTFPEWTQRIRFSGDVRVRYEGDFFPKGNDTSAGTLFNWNAINTGPPVDFTAATPPPLRDVDQDRNRFRLRARVGSEADLSDGFAAGLRIATGDSSTPVSTNQTLGGGGGNFSKYPVWLDRGYLRYKPVGDFALLLGRFDNPLYAPTDLMWYSELAFDGAAVRAKYEMPDISFEIPGFTATPTEVAPTTTEPIATPPGAGPPVVKAAGVMPSVGLTPFFVAGAFPLFNTPLNFPNNGNGAANPVAPGSNSSSTDKYLFAVQAGNGLRFGQDVAVKFGAGYFDFTNVQGRLSNPCIVVTASDVCDTDILRPSFAQFGNTYMLLRNIVPTPANNFGTINQFQYYGLASAFRIAEFTGSLDLAQFNPVHVIVDGTYVKNVAFNRDKINQVAVNNRRGTGVAGAVGNFNGGNLGAMARMTVGYPELGQFWDWKAYVAYKYLESDAVIDAFTDPDFGLGGTNLKGYIVGLSLGLGANMWASVKWMSANAIAGAPFAVDVLQLDIEGKF
jgi:hypothetical protein